MSVFTRWSARILLPAIVIASVAMFARSSTGDGFTAGVTAGLAVALELITFGAAARRRFAARHAISIALAGLTLMLAVAFFPVLAGAALLEIQPAHPPDAGGLHLSTALLFDAGVFLVTFGAVAELVAAVKPRKEPR